MLSYQHGYHAGAFADVVKHLTLIRILRYLCLKEKPIFYLETHSGRGLYDLQSTESLKTGEASEGISELWANRANLSEVFYPYLDSIRKCNPDGILRYYPGSPLIAMQHLRQMDRLYCCELHPREFQELQQIKRINRTRTKLHLAHVDGLAQLSSLLPPPERRGLIFIDPSYEVKSDYQQVPRYVDAAYHRFNQGVYCIWYPILEKKWNTQLTDYFSKINAKSLGVEFNRKDIKHGGMTGCGLWIINPPYLLAAELKLALSELVKIFNFGESSYEIIQCD